MLSEETISIPGISLNELCGVSTGEFLRPFENIVNPDIHQGMQLDFQIHDRTHNHKITPILRLARPEDAPKIVEIYKELYNGTYPYKEMEDEHEVRVMIEDPMIQWIIYQDPSFNIVGCITFVLDFESKRGYIRGFMLKKKYQGSIDITKAMIGSMIGMCHKYKNEILMWYVENRTAHAKSQYSMRVCGIAPIGFYPNKDIFLGNVESDVMQILYDERVLRDYRRKDPPLIIPEVKNCYLYSDSRYSLGEYKMISPYIKLEFKKVASLRKRIQKKVEIDGFGYETITFSFPKSGSFFQFLYTPTVNNFEKTQYQVESLEELYTFVNEFMNYRQQLGVRYCEVFLSAYHPEHQQIFYNAGLTPRGYIPSWKCNKEIGCFEDHILFNYFEESLPQDIQLIEEMWSLLEVINITPDIESQEERCDNYFFVLSSKTKTHKRKVFISTRFEKFCLMGGLLIYLLLLFSSMLVAFYANSSQFTLVSHNISTLGSKRFTPLPLLFNIACIIGGITTILLNLLQSRQMVQSETNQYQKLYKNYIISKTALLCGTIGNLGCIFLGIFSLDKAGFFHGSCAGLAFSGFILSIFLFSICVLVYQTHLPRWIGFIGILPLVTSILYSIFIYPLLEWILLFTILISLIPQFFGICILKGM